MMAKELDILKLKASLIRLRLKVLLPIILVVLTAPSVTVATSFAKCINSGWIPYKNEKCFKILNLYETHGAAISACQKELLYDDLIDSNIPTTLLTINSREEEDFVDQLLFNVSRIADNVWLGAVRDGRSSTFKLIDGTSLSNVSVYSRWASGNPSGDFSKNCVELRASDNHSANTNSSSQSSSDPTSWWSTAQSQKPPSIGPEPGTWYNALCSKHNLVVCQSSQTVTDSVVQYQLAQAKKEIRILKSELMKLKQAAVVSEIEAKKEISTIKSELFELKRVVTEIDAKKEINNLKSDLVEVKRVVSELAVNVVTDVRLGHRETTDIWRSSGFRDGTGYVITGVVNWDGNGSIDTIHRRRFEKFINGQWYDVY